MKFVLYGEIRVADHVYSYLISIILLVNIAAEKDPDRLIKKKARANAQQDYTNRR